MKAMLRPVVRRVKGMTGWSGRPSTTPQAVCERWRALSSGLVSAQHFTRAGLDNIWERYPGKLDRQIIVIQALRNVVAAGVQGAIAEFGCYMGHTAIQIAHALETLGDDSRFVLFDSFQGMPASDRAEDEYWSEGAMTADHDEVKQRFADFANVEVVAGFFRDTLPGHDDLSLKLAHVDCDLYSSVRDVNDWLLDRVVPGGVIVYDDYGFESCYGLKEAVDEDMAARPEYVKYSLPTGQYVAIRVR